MRVRIYIEGGGDQRATLAACRRGFSEFFRAMLPNAPQPSIIASGSRNAAYEDFKNALNAHRDAVVLLLVDAEAPVAAGVGPWKHLAKRDKWPRPGGTSDDHAFLMVQCMEAWFTADREALAAYFGQGFRAKALPARMDVEQVPKSDLFKALDAATKHTKTKGRYSKGAHAFDLLARLDPEKVCQASPHAKRLREALRKHGTKDE